MSHAVSQKRVKIKGQPWLFENHQETIGTQELFPPSRQYLVENKRRTFVPDMPKKTAILIFPFPPLGDDEIYYFI